MAGSSSAESSPGLAQAVIASMASLPSLTASTHPAVRCSQ
ncbi:hypothetical protein Ae331Ps2_6059c [Pseudonocardia sp. Ae331_Ps2]|nr:hypothetical protein Ae331Ps2_6059c [Pseudonocardia sp. Ae331_Ps2]